jgi:DNA-binding NtrC family response regulator
VITPRVTWSILDYHNHPKQPMDIDKAEADLGLNGFSSLSEHEKKLIQRALEATGGNKTQAAKMLGISREGLRKKIKRLLSE